MDTKLNRMQLENNRIQSELNQVANGGQTVANGDPKEKKDGHINNILLNHKLCLFGITIYTLYLEIQQIGPSFVVLRFQSDDWGGSRGAYVQAVTPLASNKQKIVHQIYQVQGFTGLLLSRFMLWSQSNMVI